MLKTTLINLFNEKLAGEMFKYDEVVSYFDAVINEINNDLSAKFPTLSEFTPTSFPGYKKELYTTYDQDGREIIDIDKRAMVYNNYDLFPNRYMESVVIPGAAYKWFSVDEEGASTAPLFQAEYDKARFEMLRDYLDLVPYEFQNNLTGACSDPFYYHKLKSGSNIFDIF